MSLKLKYQLTFIFSSLGLAELFAASATPIPLYSLYTKSIGLAKSTISLTAVFYFVGCIFALLFLTRLSSRVGRKTMAFSALLLGIIGLILLIFVQNGNMIVLARLFQGLSCGLASNVFSQMIAESGEGRVNLSLIGLVLSSAIFVGLAFGGLLSGILVQVNPHAASIVYWLLLILLLISTLGIYCGAETNPEKSAQFWFLLLPKVQVPQNKKFLLTSSLIFAGSWAMGGYFQAYSSTIASSIFHVSSPLLAAIFLISYMLPNALGSSLSERFSRRQAQIIGLIAYILAVGLFVLSLATHLLILTIVGILLAGIFQGMAYRPAMQNLLESATIKENTGTLSYIYILSYAGAGIPSFISGRLSGSLNFLHLTLTYWLLIAVLGFAALLTLQKKSKFSLDMK